MRAILLINKIGRITRLLAAGALIIASTVTTMAQKKSFTLEQVIPGGKQYHHFAPKRYNQLRFWNDQPVFIKGDTIYKLVAGRKGVDSVALITNQQLKEAAQSAMISIGARMPRLTPSTQGQPYFYFQAANRYIGYNAVTRKIDFSLPYSPKAANFEFHEAGRLIAYTIDNDVYMTNSAGDIKRITADGSADIVNGQSVHRDEWGIHNGLFWSPKGTKLAYYRMDQSMVTNYPLVNTEKRVATLDEIKYPMAGMKSHHVTVHLYDPQTGKQTALKTGEPLDRFFTNITWSPDEQSIYIAEVNRTQNQYDWVQYSASTGEKIATLYTEKNAAWVEPQHPLYFIPGKSDQLLMMSERDGNWHLYHYNTKGDSIRQITSGAWRVNEVVGFNDKATKLYIKSTEVSPLESHLYEVDMKTLQRRRLTRAEGWHQTELSYGKNSMIDQYSSRTVPYKAEWTTLKEIKPTLLLEASKPLPDYDYPILETGTLKADDGKTDLYYRLFKPTNFDPNKKYPVIVYVYGGPHLQLVRNSWLMSAGGWELYMAQKGYVVFVMDSRGSANRDAAFEKVIHRQLGETECKDQLCGIKYLRSLSFVDGERIGVNGWSFGGFMTTNLMLTYPDVYKVGVAGGAVMDWSLYEIMYGERYMDTPEENPAGYERSSVARRAKDLKGRLLIIHDDQDDVVVPQHAFRFLKEAVKAEVYPDLFIYPGHKHNVSGHERVHLFEKITRYFEDYLK